MEKKLETIEQAQNRLEITTDGKNGFYRGVLWSQGWIDVDDELPKPTVNVLVKNESCNPPYSIAYHLIEWINAFNLEKISPIPTHWRPIERI